MYLSILLWFVLKVFRFLAQLKVSWRLLLMQGVRSVFKFPLRVCFHSVFIPVQYNEKESGEGVHVIMV